MVVFLKQLHKLLSQPHSYFLSGRIIFCLFSVSGSFQRVDWLYQEPLSDIANFFFHQSVKVLNFFLFGALLILLRKGFLFLSIFNFNKKVYTITFVKFMNMYFEILLRFIDSPSNLWQMSQQMFNKIFQIFSFA